MRQGISVTTIGLGLDYNEDLGDVLSIVARRVVVAQAANRGVEAVTRHFIEYTFSEAVASAADFAVRAWLATPCGSTIIR